MDRFRVLVFGLAALFIVPIGFLAPSPLKRHPAPRSRMTQPTPSKPQPPAVPACATTPLPTSTSTTGPHPDPAATPSSCNSTAARPYLPTSTSRECLAYLDRYDVGKARHRLYPVGIGSKASVEV